MKNFISMLVLSTMVVSLCAIAMVSLSPVARAVGTDLLTKDLNVVGTQGFGEGTTTGTALPARIGKIIQVVLGALGVILIIIIVYAGFLWMTAGGEADQVKKAKDWMTNAVIGLIIILCAYAITDFVIAKLIFVAT